MDRKIGIIAGIVLLACLGSVFVYSSIIAPPQREVKPITFHIDPATVTGASSIEEAKQMILSLWDLPQVDYDVRVTATKDAQYGTTTFKLSFYKDGNNLLSALVDADTGRITSISDHRYYGTVNNIRSNVDLVNIANSALERMKVNADALPSPRVVAPVEGTAASNLYSVIWNQYYNGVPVRNGFVRVIVDSEYLKPIGFANGLRNVGDIDVKPTVSEAQVVALAGEYLKAELPASRGYSGFKAGNAVLYVARPNCDPNSGQLYVPAPGYCLTWWVNCVGKSGHMVDVVVDAHSGLVVSIEEYL
jgi:hypothetical protein